jgi:hypothetical protein
MPLMLAVVAAGLIPNVCAARHGVVDPGMSPAVIAPDLPTGEPPRNDLDQYGGWTGLQGKRTGFFHVEKLGDRWWFVTPDGNVYFMLEMGWADKEEDAPRLKSWGFNASEGGTGMPYAVNVNFFRLDTRPYPVTRLPGLPPWVSCNGMALDAERISGDEAMMVLALE